MALVFGLTSGSAAPGRFGVGFVLLGAANYLILRKKSPAAAIIAATVL